MRRITLVILISLMIGSTAFAVPTLQLFISGATYNHTTGTWVTHSGGFDLYVINAMTSKTDVIVSMALDQQHGPSDITASFGGNQLSQSDWTWGYPPISNVPEDHNGGDLAPHDVYPTWFHEFHTGAYGLGSQVGDVQPNSNGDYWDPSTGTGNAPSLGSVKMFHVETAGTYFGVHFDAYTVNSQGRVSSFAPFTHDAETTVPEPGTWALFGTGLLGLGAFSIKRRKK